MGKKGTIAKLDKLQRGGCIAALNATRSTPTQGMEIILGLTPLHIHIKSTIIMSYTRLASSNNWKLRRGEQVNPKSHCKTIERWIDNITGINMQRDKLKTKNHIQSKFQIEILERQIIKGREIKLTPVDPETVHCFTDGSKNDVSSGAGYIIRGSNIKLQGYLNLGPHSTVFQTEIVAIAKTANQLLEHNITGKTIEIFTDSQSSIKALSNYITKSKCVLICKETLNKIAMQNSIKINWIPGHEGIRGNEIADRLANIGTNQVIPNLDPTAPNIPVATSVIKSLVKTWETNEHQIRWDSTDEYRQTRIFISNVSKNYWKTISRLSRKDARWITQIITGHANLQYPLYKMKLVDSPMCEKCNENEETAAHFIGACPYYSRTRYEVLGALFLQEVDLKNLNPLKILSFIKCSNRWKERTENNTTTQEQQIN